jgi:hypothetical protein
MTRKLASYLRVVAVAIAAVSAAFVIMLGAQQPPAGGAVPIDGDDIGGMVSGPAGPEAGVWVIAETTDLPARFARSVVTDDQGRYVGPDLPKARYRVWVRGYGLVDSPKVYNVPKPYFGIRGADIDKQGVVWASMGSGHHGSFDRRKCKGPLNGPKATGDHCPEGWAFHQYPGPGFRGIGENSAESSYYTWVDQHNTFGLGADVPMSTANLNDGLVALKDGKMILLRVPYPLGFYAKGFDGRIDDRSAGWKGRGLWTTSGDRTPWLMEGGQGKKPIVVHFQLRPDPLAH